MNILAFVLYSVNQSSYIFWSFFPFNVYADVRRQTIVFSLCNISEYTVSRETAKAVVYLSFHLLWMLLLHRVKCFAHSGFRIHHPRTFGISSVIS